MSTVRTPFRLAFRSEGDFVNAYYAATDTMKDALLLGSMRKSILNRSPGTWDVWRMLMQDVLAHACDDALGAAPTEFIMERAPEHERSGAA